MDSVSQLTIPESVILNTYEHCVDQNPLLATVVSKKRKHLEQGPYTFRDLFTSENNRHSRELEQFYFLVLDLLQAIWNIVEVLHWPTLNIVVNQIHDLRTSIIAFKNLAQDQVDKVTAETWMTSVRMYCAERQLVRSSMITLLLLSSTVLDFLDLSITSKHPDVLRHLLSGTLDEQVLANLVQPARMQIDYLLTNRLNYKKEMGMNQQSIYDHDRTGRWEEIAGGMDIPDSMW